MLRLLLIAFLLAIALGMAIANPFGALIAYQWFAYFRPQEWVWTDITGLRLSLVLGLILVFRCLAAGVWPNLSHRMSIGMLVFLLTGIVAQSNAIRPDIGWQWVDHFARLTLLTLLMISLVNTPRRLFLAVLVIAASLGIRSAKAGLTSLLSGGFRIAEGYGGSFTDNNAFALAMVMIMPMLWALSNAIPEQWKFRRTLAWSLRMATLFTAYAVVSTYSRGALLALAGGFLAYLWTLPRRRIGIVVVVVLVAVASAPFVTLPDGYTERMETITTYEEVDDDSALSRLHFWKVAWEMAKDHPLGIGMFNFQSNYDQYDFLDGRYGRARALHSSHLQVLAEQGFLAFFVWVWLFVSAFASCRRIRKLASRELAGTSDAALFCNLAQAFTVSMVTFLIGGAFLNLALNEITWNTFALVAAMEGVVAAAVLQRSAASREPARLASAGRYSAARARI